jgi:hypothetical protein
MQRSGTPSSSGVMLSASTNVGPRRCGERHRRRAPYLARWHDDLHDEPQEQ